MSVEITDIRIFRTFGAKVKAYVTVTLGDEFAVHGCRILEREDGALWVSMPRQRSSFDGSWRDIFHPITKESRERLNDAILKAYEKTSEEVKEPAKPPKAEKKKKKT